MQQQTNNPTSQHDENIVPQENQDTVLNSQSQNMILNEDEETMDDEEDGNPGDALFPISSDAPSNKENSFEKNEFPAADDDEFEDEEDTSSIDEIDEIEEVDSVEEDIVEENTEIINEQKNEGTVF